MANKQPHAPSNCHMHLRTSEPLPRFPLSTDVSSPPLASHHWRHRIVKHVQSGQEIRPLDVNSVRKRQLSDICSESHHAVRQHTAEGYLVTRLSRCRNLPGASAVYRSAPGHEHLQLGNYLFLHGNGRLVGGHLGKRGPGTSQVETYLE